MDCDFEGFDNVQCLRCDVRDLRARGGNEMIDISVLEKIPNCPQTQDSLTDQLKFLRMVANRLGLYDAADHIKNTLESK